MNFTFSIPQNVVFGSGAISKLPELAAKLGKLKALIISGPHLEKIGLVAKCSDAMKSGNIAVNPRKTERDDVIDMYRKAF